MIDADESRYPDWRPVEDHAECGGCGWSIMTRFGDPPSGYCQSCADDWERQAKTHGMVVRAVGS